MITDLGTEQKSWNHQIRNLAKSDEDKTNEKLEEAHEQKLNTLIEFNRWYLFLVKLQTKFVQIEKSNALREEKERLESWIQSLLKNTEEIPRAHKNSVNKNEEKSWEKEVRVREILMEHITHKESIYQKTEEYKIGRNKNDRKRRKNGQSEEPEQKH